MPSPASHASSAARTVCTPSAKSSERGFSERRWAPGSTAPMICSMRPAGGVARTTSSGWVTAGARRRLVKQAPASIWSCPCIQGILDSSRSTYPIVVVVGSSRYRRAQIFPRALTPISSVRIASLIDAGPSSAVLSRVRAALKNRRLPLEEVYLSAPPIRHCLEDGSPA
jgi:hypothetical protein